MNRLPTIGLLRALLVSLVLLSTAMTTSRVLPAQGQVPLGNVPLGNAPQGQVPQGHASAPDHAPAQGHAKSTLTMGNSEFFVDQYEHMEPHALAGHPESLLAFWDVNAYQLGAVLLILLLFLPVVASLRSGAGRAPWLVRVFRGWVHWIRDDMVVPVMGKEEGRTWTPFFAYVFFFIAICNTVGLIPGTKTATSTVHVTGAMALVTLAIIVVGGMMQQGVVAFWVHLLPPGLPFWMVPLMAVVELIGLLVKPFALAVRLFANMLAGHLVIYSFIGMIFLFAKMMEMSWFAWLTAVPSVAMAVFIYIIEALIVLLQAYIFTYLSIIFIQQARHPAH